MGEKVKGWTATTTTKLNSKSTFFRTWHSDMQWHISYSKLWHRLRKVIKMRRKEKQFQTRWFIIHIHLKFTKLVVICCDIELVREKNRWFSHHYIFIQSSTLYSRGSLRRTPYMKCVHHKNMVINVSRKKNVRTTITNEERIEIDKPSTVGEWTHLNPCTHYTSIHADTEQKIKKKPTMTMRIHWCAIFAQQLHSARNKEWANGKWGERKEEIGKNWKDDVRDVFLLQLNSNL